MDTETPEKKATERRGGPAPYLAFIGLILGVSLAWFTVLHFVRTDPKENPAPAPAPSPSPVPDEASARCAACHADHHRYWSKGGHASVACEACHGPAGDHVLEEIEERPSMLLAGNEQCMSCHGRRADRTDDPLRTIESLEKHIRDIEEHHVIKVKQARERKKCVFCHDPHLHQ